MVLFCPIIRAEVAWAVFWPKTLKQLPPPLGITTPSAAVSSFLMPLCRKSTAPSGIIWIAVSPALDSIYKLPVVLVR